MSGLFSGIVSFFHFDVVTQSPSFENCLKAVLNCQVKVVEQNKMNAEVVKDLLAMEADINLVSDPKSPEVKRPKLYCLVYWIEDKQVSIENITSVREDSRKESAISKIRFKDGRRYPGKILKISGKFDHFSVLLTSKYSFVILA